VSARVEDVTAVVANYRTLDLTRRCVESFRAHYPDVRLLLIDNGSADESTEYIRGLGEDLPNVSTQLNAENRYHGPALDQGIRSAETAFVFTLDSDCEVVSGGFLERMLQAFAVPETYAIGELRYKNRFGFTYAYGYEGRPAKERWIPYVHPYAMLLDRGKYLRLRPFVHHGAPCLRNMRDAKKARLRVLDFPIGDYVVHRMQGTSASQGYGLRAGTRQRVEYYLSRLEGVITRDPTFPVRPPSGDE
jgi:glycosyltransferase involved in cell wall biosynthesis